MALTKISGSVIKDSVSLSGNVSIGGTLTYQDVTNVDALGIGTFRTGIKVLAGQIDVGSNIKLGNAGVVTATSFVGSGANLTNLNASNIASGTVPTARLGSGTASSSTFLRGDSTFQTVNTDLVSDTSPQLGGNLDTNSHHVHFDNLHAIRWEAGNTPMNFQMYHESGYGMSLQNGNGAFYIQNATGNDNNIFVRAKSGENSIKAIANGAVELYHDNVKTFATKSGGNTLTGTDSSGNISLGRFYYKTESGTVRALFDPYAQKFQHYDNTYATFGNNHDLNIFHNGSNSYIQDNGTGALYIGSGNSSGAGVYVRGKHGEESIICNSNGSVSLYYDNSKKFETASSGVTVTGTCSATAFSSSGGTLTGVAFAAVRTAGNSNNTPFVFNSEEFDIGSDYNSSNGIFTAPDIGYYQITVQMTSTTYSGNRSFSLESSTNGGGSWTQRANALTGTPGGANESINMFIGGVFKTTVTNQQFRVKVDNQFRGTETYSRFSAFKL